MKVWLKKQWSILGALVALSLQSKAQYVSPVASFRWDVSIPYTNIEPTRDIVLTICYSNSSGWNGALLGAFCVNSRNNGLTVEIRQAGRTVSTITGAPSPSPSLEPARFNDLGTVMADVTLTHPAMQLTPGQYEIVVRYWRQHGDSATNRELMAEAAPLAFNVVPKGTSTPERPRPWGEYKDSRLYPEWKRFVATLPSHRLGSALSAAWFGKTKMHDTLVRTFCDPEVPENLRLQVVTYVTPGFVRNDDLLKVALSDKESKTLRIRAMALIGMMQDNAQALATLRAKFYAEQIAAGVDVDLRAGAILAPGPTPEIIAAASADVDPSVRLVAANWLDERKEYAQAHALALAMTNLPGTVNELVVEWRKFPGVTNTISSVAAFMAVRAANGQALRAKYAPQPPSPPGAANEPQKGGAGTVP